MPWTSPVPVKRKGTGVTPIPSGNKTVQVLPPQGINQVDPLAGQFPPLDGVFMYNFIASRYGTRVRTGYKQFILQVTGSSNPGTKTIIPYNGTVSANDRLFVATPIGMVDITNAPTKVAKIGWSPTGKSGYGVWCAFTTLAGFFMTYFDAEYGYYLYTESTDGWSKVPNTDVTGVDPAKLVFGTIYKAKIWCIQDGTSDAWYLPTGAVIGAATRFSFGNKFKHGGTLQALYVWTNDSVNVEEYLVGISSTGEVIVYIGDDPSDATNFREVGSWFIGTVPIGRRIAGSFGGDLYLLSVYGLLPISKLIAGDLAQVDTIELTRKISPAVQQAMAISFLQYGWEVKLIPSENALMIVTPGQTGFPLLQYVQALNNQGWCTYLNMPVFTGEVWNGKFYFAGGNDNNVYTHEGTTDNNDGTTGTEITASLLGGFFDYDSPGIYHRGQMIRPVFLSQNPPNYAVEVRYDYNISESFATGSVAPATGSLWDSALWDVGIWGGDASVDDSPQGTYGIGRSMAVGIQLTASVATTLIRFDLIFDEAADISL